MDYEEALRRISDYEDRLGRLETLEFPGTNLLVQDEGATLPGSVFREMNFTGAGVVASVDPVNPLKAIISFAAGGGKGPITGCWVARTGYALGTSTYWEWEFDLEVWDPDDMFNAGVDPNRVQIISTGYWAVFANIWLLCDHATLTDDQDKIAQVGGDILIYDGFAIDDEWDFQGGALFCPQIGLGLTSYRQGTDITMFGIYRHDGSNSNPWVGGEILVQKDPIAGWTTNPDITSLAVLLYVVKLGDLET